MDQIEAGADLIRQLDAGRFGPVQVAFWLRRDEEDQWNFFIASDKFDWSNRAAGYEEVSRITNQRPSIFFDPLGVSLIKGDDRLAIAARPFKTNFRGTWLRWAQFGNQFIANAYIYPTPLAPDFPRFLPRNSA